MESDIVVSVKNLKKNFGRGDILKDISFDLPRGKTLSIIGPSGSGKSTILRCLCQLTPVSGGTIEVCGGFLVKNGRASCRERVYVLV